MRRIGVVGAESWCQLARMLQIRGAHVTLLDDNELVLKHHSSLIRPAFF